MSLNVYGGEGSINLLYSNPLVISFGFSSISIMFKKFFTSQSSSNHSSAWFYYRYCSPALSVKQNENIHSLFQGTPLANEGDRHIHR